MHPVHGPIARPRSDNASEIGEEGTLGRMAAMLLPSKYVSNSAIRSGEARKNPVTNLARLSLAASTRSANLRRQGQVCQRVVSHKAGVHTVYRGQEFLQDAFQTSHDFRKARQRSAPTILLG